MFDKNTASHPYGGQRFYSLNQYCKATYGEKVYRLSLNGGMTCPNRDGTYSHQGCIYCSEGGSGDFAATSPLSIHDQLAEAKVKISQKTNCNKYIAYFQAFTNTYAPISYLRELFFSAINEPNVVILSIATRSDCLSDEVCDLLEELNRIKPVWVELGLQTIHDSTLSKMNTHTTVSQYDIALAKLKARGIEVITHLIFGFPGESKEMMLQSVNHVAHSSTAGIKMHLLHILKGTKLGDMYLQSPFPIFELEEYCNFIVDCIELLPPDMVIHRMTGDGPRNLLIAPIWSTDKKRVLNTINHLLVERDTYQGRLWTPNI